MHILNVLLLLSFAPLPLPVTLYQTLAHTCTLSHYAISHPRLSPAPSSLIRPPPMPLSPLLPPTRPYLCPRPALPPSPTRTLPAATKATSLRQGKTAVMADTATLALAQRGWWTTGRKRCQWSSLALRTQNGWSHHISISSSPLCHPLPSMFHPRATAAQPNTHHTGY